MDHFLDFIRMGDNVVWKVNQLEEFREFALAFTRATIEDGRNIIYVRFAQHEPFLEPTEGLKIYSFNPEEGFEAFTLAIHRMIECEGREAFYVFDSLSELQSVWYTDLMMGNFFCVTCPYLFELDTVAYFPIIRGRHSFETIAKIRDTTQLLLDVNSDERDVYIHPLKVWNRYSDHMFMPHVSSKGEGRFTLVSSGVAVSKYYRLLEEHAMDGQDQNLDSYDRFFALARLKYEQGNFTREMEEMIIDSTMTKDERLKKMILEYFKPEDYFRFRKRMVGSGSIGGKACGMLLARRILKTNIEGYKKFSEPHDSYYIGSDVFYTYIVFNKSWPLRIRQRTEKGFLGEAENLKNALLKGTFPSDIREQFKQLLEYYGQSPIIVRSSSFLEDGFGNAFAGKYESVFCVNQGTLDERLEMFEQAVRTVYASTMDISALEYRRQRGLEDKDEQMAILVQRVSGSRMGDYFLPSAAGVGFSHSIYKIRPDTDSSAGMLRIVVGLGTRAVDRTENDYPRLSNLDIPTVTVHTTIADKHRFSQRKVDVLDIKENAKKEIALEDLLPLMPFWNKKMVLEHDYDAEDILRKRGERRDIWFISCQKLLENVEFTDYMKKVLKTLERIYGNPVDIEYTVNLDENGNFVVCLLQCRPLYTGKEGRVEIPKALPEKIFFEIKDSSMGSPVSIGVDVVVQISAKEYYGYPYGKKQQVASAIGKINEYYKKTGKHVMLLTPGRIGTSSPELGVPVNFAQISGFCGICEVSDQNYGHIPDLSYGSHMFQDLVEAEISYGAILNNHKTIYFHEDMFAERVNKYVEICPEMEELSTMIRVVETEGLHYYMNPLENHALCVME
ncbi:MAG: PEP/pyruvate-binding domain-containing protein [Roseburia sp.]